MYVMNSTNFVNWQNGDAFSTYYSSGEATTGNIYAEPPSGGTYFLVFDNTFSTTSKNVDTDVDVMYMPSTKLFKPIMTSCLRKYYCRTTLVPVATSFYPSVKHAYCILAAISFRYKKFCHNFLGKSTLSPAEKIRIEHLNI